MRNAPSIVASFFFPIRCSFAFFSRQKVTAFKHPCFYLFNRSLGLINLESLLRYPGDRSAHGETEGPRHGTV